MYCGRINKKDHKVKPTLRPVVEKFRSSRLVAWDVAVTTISNADTSPRENDIQYTANVIKSRTVLYCYQAGILLLKEPQVIETRSFPNIGYALITPKTQVKINFVQYLNFN